MRITILGCGSSSGVPNLMGYWGVCNPENPKNRRLRSSLLVETKGGTLLIDASPDLRAQMLACNSPKLDAVIITHAHYDHIGGIDELRSVFFHQKTPLALYSDSGTLAQITRQYPYLLGHSKINASLYPKVLDLHEVPTDASTRVCDQLCSFFPQDHGAGMVSLGIRFPRWAYSTDIHTLSDSNCEHLRDLDLWIVDCIARVPVPTHSHLEQTLAWIERVRPRQAILTHLGVGMDYDEVSEMLPPHVRLAYDGLTVSLSMVPA